MQTRLIISSRLREIEDSSVSLSRSIGFLLVLTPSTDHDSYRHTRRKTSQNSSRNSLRLVMVNSMHDSTYVWVHAQLGCLVLISVRDKVMVTRCSDIETSLNICTTRLPITPSTIVLSTLVDYNSFLWIDINTMVHIGMVGGRNSRTKSFGLRPGIGCLLQLAGLLAVKDKRAAAW